MVNNNKGTKTIAIVAALIALVGLGVGFAAFTRTLTISSSATVNPTDTFDVHFNTSSSTSGVNACTTSSASVTATPGTVTATSITGVTASLKAPGDYAICKYEITNESSYTAFLNAVSFDKAILCTPAAGTTTSLVTAACAHIKMTVQVGGTEFGTGGVSVTNTTSGPAANNAISSHSVAGGHTELVFLKIYYDNDGNAATELADGVFTVNDPELTSKALTISLKYDTTDTPAS